MTEINPYIFRAYDVRGKVGIDILPEVFSEVGRAYGTLVRRRGGRTVAIGMDNRTTSPPLKEAFAEGMLSTGLDVVDIGVNHTPLLYFAVAHWRVDGGNGIAGSFAPELLRRLGCEVTELYCESDGTFPNHLPDPEMEENVRDLVAKVVETRADVGIAYDGDADRMGVIDDRGRRHEADLILALLARDLLTRHPGAPVVFDVKSSQALADDIRAHGGKPIMWKTGHSHLKQKMRDDGILLGGEVSGHMFFGENWYGVDDGILASCKFLELAEQTGGSISALFDTLPHLVSTPELKAPCPDDKKFAVVAELAAEFKGRYETIDIEGVRILFPEGWGLVRASNTNPYLTLRFEGRTRAALEEMKRVVFDALRRYPFVQPPR